MGTVSVAVRLGAALLARPSLWGTAARLGRRSIPRRWWRSAPYLPVPPRDYLAFRLQTQYGSEPPDSLRHDFVEYLEWCRLWERGA